MSIFPVNPGDQVAADTINYIGNVALNALPSSGGTISTLFANALMTVTMALSDNSANVATTAFVQDVVANVSLPPDIVVNSVTSNAVTSDSITVQGRDPQDYVLSINSQYSDNNNALLYIGNPDYGFGTRLISVCVEGNQEVFGINGEGFIYFNQSYAGEVNFFGDCDFSEANISFNYIYVGQYAILGYGASLQQNYPNYNITNSLYLGDTTRPTGSGNYGFNIQFQTQDDNGNPLDNPLTIFRSNSTALFTQTVVANAIQITPTGPVNTAGTGAPTGTYPTASLYQRTDGSPGSLLYITTSPGTWAVVY